MTVKPNTYEVKIEVIDGHYLVTERWYDADYNEQQRKSHQKILGSMTELLTYLQEHALSTIVGMN